MGCLHTAHALTRSICCARRQLAARRPTQSWMMLQQAGQHKRCACFCNRTAHPSARESTAILIPASVKEQRGRCSTSATAAAAATAVETHNLPGWTTAGTPSKGRYESRRYTVVSCHCPAFFLYIYHEQVTSAPCSSLQQSFTWPYTAEMANPNFQAENL